MDCDDVPSAALTNDDYSSVESDDDIIFSAACPCCKSPEGATEVVVPPPRRSARLKVPTPPHPTRRSIRLRGEEAPSVNLADHPDYAQCNTILVTDMMRDKGFIQANKAQFSCTLVTKQPPRIAMLCSKKKEYKSILTSDKLRESNETLGAMDWEIPSPGDFLEDNLTKFVHFAAADCGFGGSIEALVVNWLHHLMLESKTANTDGENPTWRKEMNGPFADEYWEESGT